MFHSRCNCTRTVIIIKLYSLKYCLSKSLHKLLVIHSNRKQVEEKTNFAYLQVDSSSCMCCIYLKFVKAGNTYFLNRDVIK